MVSVDNIKKLLANCIDYDKVLKLMVEIRKTELQDNVVIIPVNKIDKDNYLNSLTENTSDFIVREMQKAMVFDAYRIIYSSPHISKDNLNTEDIKIEEEKKEGLDKDIFDGIVFTPSPSEEEDIENELNTKLKKRIDFDLFKKLGVDIEQ